jgi:hypothetical protein
MIHRLLTPAIILLALTHVAFSEPVEVNGIAAKVNGRVITKNQVSFMLAPIYAQLAAQFPRRGPQFEAEFNKAKAGVIQELVDRQIILDEFKQLGASIKPHIIDEEVKRQMRELYNGDEVKFREELKRSRLTMPGYREMTREKMVVQAMRAQQFADAPPPLPNEIRKEYDEVKLTLRDAAQQCLADHGLEFIAHPPLEAIFSLLLRDDHADLRVAGVAPPDRPGCARQCFKPSRDLAQSIRVDLGTNARLEQR